MGLVQSERNGCSTIGAGRGHDAAVSPVGRTATRRLGADGGEGVIRQGGRTSGHGVGGHRHAYLTRGWRSGPEDFDQGSASDDTQDQAHGQERELARGHPAGILVAAPSEQSYPRGSVVARESSVNLTTRPRWPRDA